ncbi:MAG: hypothetical protein NXY59_08210 [Aigarchaeota archaeon]|nr:hypothetical protein [Candidatus Pelearchaeum maunauluense]
MLESEKARGLAELKGVASAALFLLPRIAAREYVGSSSRLVLAEELRRLLEEARRGVSDPWHATARAKIIVAYFRDSLGLIEDALALAEMRKKPSEVDVEGVLELFRRMLRMAVGEDAARRRRLIA